MVKRYIFTPGPTPISEEVLLEHARPLLHHRSPEFSKIFIEVAEKLKKLFKTQNDVFILTSSGTGAMEAAITNSFSVGDKVLVASAGNFGERFEKISKKFGLDVILLDYEWGDNVNPDDIKKSLDENPDIKGVMLQFSETSTGALNDIETIGSIVKNYQAILIVDAISGIGASDLRTDEWSVDIAIGGSQKALSAPTGVAFMSISEKAWKLIEKSDIPCFYFDLMKAKEASLRTPPQTPWTPGISIIVAMNKALDMLFEEGQTIRREAVIKLLKREPEPYEEEWEEDFETIKALKICYKALKNQMEETINAGRKNQHVWEIYGSKGSMFWDLEDLNHLYVNIANVPIKEVSGFTKVNVTDPIHPFSDMLWPPGHNMGWESGHINEILHFIDAVVNDKSVEPYGATFYDGYVVQLVMDAVKKSSISGKKVKIRTKI